MKSDLTWKEKRKIIKNVKERVKKEDFPSVDELKKYIDFGLFGLVEWVIWRNYNGIDGSYYADKDIKELHDYLKGKEPSSFHLFSRLSYSSLHLSLQPIGGLDYEDKNKGKTKR
ncbi:MAG: hypothetical protein J7L43_00740 [Candidatus Aenigmarchaeota archaeon]|nr:hypothetical protein [Candidatus Aenigmarchaeota archaeon]